MATRNITLVVAFLTAGAMLASVSSSFAAERQLRFSEEQLANDSGATAAYEQIVQISEEICIENFDGARLVRYRAERERCIIELVDQAITDAENPALSAIHARAIL